MCGGNGLRRPSPQAAHLGYRQLNKRGLLTLPRNVSERAWQYGVLSFLPPRIPQAIKGCQLMVSG